MFGIETLTGSTQAAALVGSVFIEALVLYVGYGLVMRALGPMAQQFIGGE